MMKGLAPREDMLEQYIAEVNILRDFETAKRLGWTLAELDAHYDEYPYEMSVLREAHTVEDNLLKKEQNKLKVVKR